MGVGLVSCRMSADRAGWAEVREVGDECFEVIDVDQGKGVRSGMSLLEVQPLVQPTFTRFRAAHVR